MTGAGHQASALSSIQALLPGVSAVSSFCLRPSSCWRAPCSGCTSAKSLSRRSALFTEGNCFRLFCSEDLSLGLLCGIRCIHTCGSGARCENGNAGCGRDSRVSGASCLLSQKWRCSRLSRALEKQHLPSDAVYSQTPAHKTRKHFRCSQPLMLERSANQEVPTFLGAPLASCLRENNWSYSVPRTPSKILGLGGDCILALGITPD